MEKETLPEDYTQSVELEEPVLLQAVREIASYGNIRLSGHLINDRMSSRGYSLRDIIYILKRGKLNEKRFDNEHQNWSYTICGEDLDGDPGGVVTTVLNRNELFIITVLGGDCHD